jgi:hypothetical protein
MARLPRDGGPRSGTEAVQEFLRARGCSEGVVSDGLEGLVAEWERVAESVHQGYPLDTLDDYLNDMDLRQLIAEALATVPTPTWGALTARLTAADARIRSGLVPAGRCLWGEAIAARRGWSAASEWWYFMRPAQLGPGLRAELKPDEER